MQEFEIIKTLFQRPTDRDDVILGSGDDAALLQIPPGQQLAVSIDTLVEGVHFPENTAPADIGYKALAVSLSDMAAMAAMPAWVTASLTVPVANTEWLEKFASGFFSLANEFNLALVGGDLSHGPLSITTQLHGFCAPGKAWRRAGAQVGDVVVVTGYLGEAAAALQYTDEQLQQRLNRPTPRVREALRIIDAVHAAIDISDGLLADLNHILKASKVGATLDIEKIALSDALLKNCNKQEALQFALTGGDDYELCLVVPEQNVSEVLTNLHCPAAVIGKITADPGLQIPGCDPALLSAPGYNHFA